MVSALDSILAIERQEPRSVVLPESEESRVLAAAQRMVAEGVARPILVGKRNAIARAAVSAGVDLTGTTWVDPVEDDRRSAYVASYVQARPRTKAATAERLLQRPLYYAGMMVGTGDADVVVAGAANATRKVIEAGMLTVGLAEGVSTPSSFFLMLVPGFRNSEWYPLIFADCAVNIEPDADELAAIATASAASAKRLLAEPSRVAMLSYSTDGSAQHDKLTVIHDAMARVQQQDPTIAIDGELQVDTALVASVAQQKLKRESSVAGQANVLIFPDLNAGNIGYKLVQHLVGATALGPILQGFARPVIDLSRGAGVEDILATTRVALALS